MENDNTYYFDERSLANAFSNLCSGGQSGFQNEYHFRANENIVKSKTRKGVLTLSAIINQTPSHPMCEETYQTYFLI